MKIINYLILACILIPFSLFAAGTKNCKIKVINDTQSNYVEHDSLTKANIPLKPGESAILNEPCDKLPKEILDNPKHVFKLSTYDTKEPKSLKSGDCSCMGIKKHKAVHIFFNCRQGC